MDFIITSIILESEGISKLNYIKMIKLFEKNPENLKIYEIAEANQKNEN